LVNIRIRHCIIEIERRGVLVVSITGIVAVLIMRVVVTIEMTTIPPHRGDGQEEDKKHQQQEPFHNFSS
jgi:hypothetical protein